MRRPTEAEAFQSCRRDEHLCPSWVLLVRSAIGGQFAGGKSSTAAIIPAFGSFAPANDACSASADEHCSSLRCICCVKPITRIWICMIVGAGALDGPHLRNETLARGVEGAAPYSFSSTNLNSLRGLNCYGFAVGRHDPMPPRSKVRRWDLFAAKAPENQRTPGFRRGPSRKEEKK